MITPSDKKLLTKLINSDTLTTRELGHLQLWVAILLGEVNRLQLATDCAAMELERLLNA